MKLWKTICAVVTAAAVLSVFSCGMVSAADGGEIHVNGSGVVQVQPDTAKISLSVSTTGKTAQAAQAENNKITKNVTVAMEGLGIAKDKIVTAYTSVYPTYRYDQNTGKSTVAGYESHTELQVTTKDIDHAGKYIDAALHAGATGSNGVSFSVEDQSAYYAQALQIAVKNAAKSANAIASAYGKPLGAVKSVTENSHNYDYVENAPMAKTMAAEEAVADAGGTNISYGKIEISANISVTYQF